MKTLLGTDEAQALTAADATPLQRWSDGMWRPMGGTFTNSPAYEHRTIRRLASMRLVEMMPVGAIITAAGRDAIVHRK